MSDLFLTDEEIWKVLPHAWEDLSDYRAINKAGNNKILNELKRIYTGYRGYADLRDNLEELIARMEEE